MSPISKREFSHHATCGVNDVGMSSGAGDGVYKCRAATMPNDENAFILLDWMEAIEVLRNGETR
jgi:hypothetical protein